MPGGAEGDRRAALEADPRQAIVALDANALDPAPAEQQSTAERLRQLIETGLISVMLVEGVARERARAPGKCNLADSSTQVPGPGRKRTAADEIARIRVRAILRGDAAPGKHDADAAHLCDAAEAGCGYFVTRDRRFWRKRRDLEATLPSIRILDPARFLDLYDDAAGAGATGGVRPNR